MVSAEHIESVVHRYLDLVANGTAEEVAELYAVDGTVEDPVGGGEVHIGRQAIAGFYRNIESASKQSELIMLRVAGHEAAFLFGLTIKTGDQGIRIEPIDVMVFDSEGKIASMKAYWSASDIKPV